MRVETIVTGPLQVNTFLVWKEVTDPSAILRQSSGQGSGQVPSTGSGSPVGLRPEGQAQVVIIDPGDEAGRLMEEITKENLSLGAILVTHAHFDHVGAVDELRRWSGAAVCFPDGERKVLRQLPDSCRFFGVPEKPIPKVDHWLNPSSAGLARVMSPDQLGGLEIAVHATPGHSPGGVCYQIEDHWFVGDTLFCGSVGRVDLPGGDWPALQASLRFLMGLPDDTLIYPGHGPGTTIGREKRTNPFLLELDQRDTAHV